MKLWTSLLLLVSLFHQLSLISGQPGGYAFTGKRKYDDITWCTISHEEQKKCTEWSEQILSKRNQEDTLQNQNRFNQQQNNPFDYGTSNRYVPNEKSGMSFSSNPWDMNLKCHQAGDKHACMNLMANQRVNLVTLDPGEVFMGGRYHSLVPIMSERYGMTQDPGYYSVAVVKRDSANYIKSLEDLRNKKACFPGVGKMAGWVLPMATMLGINILPVNDCNNMVKNVATFFNDSCAPNALIDKHNPTGDNPTSMCALCRDACSGSGYFANFDGALRCLSESGDVAFVKHTTIEMMQRQLVSTKNQLGISFNKQDFELLCPDGRRSSVDGYKSCNFGFVPADAIVTLSSVLPEQRQKIQRFLQLNSEIFGSSARSRGGGATFQKHFPLAPRNRSRDQPEPTLNPNQEEMDTFYLMGSKLRSNAMGNAKRPMNLLFSEDTTALSVIMDSKQTFSGYLGSYVHYFDKLQSCIVPVAKLCVVSDKEMEKCNRMRTAFRAQMLKPDLSCVRAHDKIECMENIDNGFSDLVVLDAGDMYRAGAKFNLIPIVAEKSNLEDASYYVVAVARQSDKDTDLLYLKGKRSCHTGFGEAAGWTVPLSFLLSNRRMRSYGDCEASRAASQYFEKSCVPGSLSTRFVGSNTEEFGNLCDLCHGDSYLFCARDSSEPFYGATGALRCLIEGFGQIAFTRHTAILENAARRSLHWARNMVPGDFELLCRDGTRANYTHYRTCNLGRVSANAIVTSRHRPKEHIDAYIHLFMLAQQFYGSKYSEDFTFKMFDSDEHSPDLIFSDSTSQLVQVPVTHRQYGRYLGHEFMRSAKIVDCSAGSATKAYIMMIGGNIIFLLIHFMLNQSFL